jgi:hypothetical protein
VSFKVDEIGFSCSVAFFWTSGLAAAGGGICLLFSATGFGAASTGLTGAYTGFGASTGLTGA